MLATKEYVDEVLGKLGHAAKKSLGQNFLVSDHVVSRIIKKTLAFNPATLIEVGPGPGSLTRHIVDQRPVLIELDRSFAEHWRSQGLEVIEADALQVNWDPFYRARPCVLMSNLPYQISSSLVIERSLDLNPLDAMVLMFQREVAQRIRAQLKSEPYGFLSIFAQTFWHIETVVDAGPRDFSPPPRVASRVLSFTPKAHPLTNKQDYLTVLKAGFAQPRKLLLTNLQSYQGFTRSYLQGIFTKLNLDLNIRPDQLTVDQWINLYLQLKENLP